MPAFNITAHSDTKNMNVSNTNRKFPSPAQFDTQELAQAQADKYARDLNHDDHEAAWDWVGVVSAA